MIIMKFGGTSVGSAEAIQRVAGIVQSRYAKQPVVVVSAVGHVTDDLVEISHHAARRDRLKSYDLILACLKKHRQLIHDLSLHEVPTLRNMLAEVEDQLKKIADIIIQAAHTPRHVFDELLSIGEYLSANILSQKLIAAGIESVMVDSRSVVITDSQFGKAQPLLTESKEGANKNIIPLVKKGVVPVLQGFVGRDIMGRTTTLGRGGSDFTATFLGALLDADLVEIWTDVDGILTADPTLVPDAKHIRILTFQEAAELAYFGAKVLHPATLLPAIDKNIPVSVLNSHRLESSGTLITPNAAGRYGDGCVVKSIAYKENITVITVTSTRMLMAHGFLASIFEVFNKYQTSIDLVSTSEVSVSMTIDQTGQLAQIKKELSRFAEVEVQTGKAIVCLVGEKMRQTPGMPGLIFAVLQDVTIHLISQGASEINISFVVDEEILPTVINILHHRFFGGALNPDIFVVDGIEEIQK